MISFELAIGYVALLFMTRLLGKTTITQISTFDFIAVLILGELLGAAMYAEHTTWKMMLFAMAFWFVLIYGTKWITQKVRKTRKILEGSPSIVIANGKIDYNVMKKNLIDLHQLQMLLRIKDVFSIREVDYAIIEANGDLSILKKYPYAAPTNNDMNFLPKAQTLSYSLILDGEIIEENLPITEKNKEWLEAEIKHFNLNQIEDVLFAEWNDKSGLFAQGY